jgi:transketolase
MDYIVDTLPGSAYLRLVSVKWPMPFAYPAGQRVAPGTGWVVREGGDLVVFGYGPWMLAHAWEAAERIERETAATIRLVNLPWLNRVDERWLRDVIGSCRAIATLDNHYLRGGQGEMIAAAVAALGLAPAVRVSRLGVTELPECGTNDEVLAYHHLDVDGLVAALRDTLPARDPGRKKPVEVA